MAPESQARPGFNDSERRRSHEAGRGKRFYELGEVVFLLMASDVWFVVTVQEPSKSVL